MMIALLRFLACRVTVAILAAAALSLGAVAPMPGRAQGSPSSGTPCSSLSSGQGVVITSCSYTLASSPAGNPNYFVDVTLRYTAPANTAAIRFRCMLSDGNNAIPQYGVLRSSGSTLNFVSPFVKAGGIVRSVSCYVDAT